MEIRIEEANRALFEFEDAMYDLEDAYAKAGRYFNVLMGQYHRMKRQGADDVDLHVIRRRMLVAHLGLRRHAVNLHDVHNWHGELIRMTEYYLEHR